MRGADSYRAVAQELEIRLSSHSYPIRFGAEAASSLESLHRQLEVESRPSAMLVDAAVAKAAAGLLDRHLGGLPRLSLPAGESAKSAERLVGIWDFLAEHRLDRRSVLWVVGGGVTGDLGGFAAASYLRGIDFVQIPTTLLAMVDSSVGGKTGINIPAGKNLVGAFHHPRAVFILPEFLDTLPPREFAAGMAEVIKYGLLGDPELFDRLARNPVSCRDAGLLGVIRRCCAIKAAVVQADERETAAEGGRALLNLGHTFGHAIEKVAGFGTYLHGEAVAIGLAAAARASVRLGVLQAAEIPRIDQVLGAHGLPTRLRSPLSTSELLAAMRSDKKVRAGKLRLVLLRRIGEAFTKELESPAVAEAVWADLGAKA